MTEQTENTEEYGNREGRSLQRTRRALQALIGDETGVTAIEYALLGTLIAVAIAGSVTALGTQLQVLWTAISTAVAAAVS